MNKVILRKIKNVLMITFLVCFNLYINEASTLKEENHAKKDTETVEWCKRADVQNSLNELLEVSDEMAAFCQEIYNLYAPYTIGKTKMMYNRVKSLLHLLNLEEKVRSIYLYYYLTPQSHLTDNEKMNLLIKNILSKYFDPSLKILYFKNISIITELNNALDSLCNKELNPDFERVTHFNKIKFFKILAKIDAAIHAAMATIPGGKNALKQ